MKNTTVKKLKLQWGVTILTQKVHLSQSLVLPVHPLAKEKIRKESETERKDKQSANEEEMKDIVSREKTRFAVYTWKENVQG